MTNANPSINPPNGGSMTGMFREVLQKFLQGSVDDMLPASVIEFDRTTNLAKVQPMILMVKTNNEQVKRAPVASVPVFQIGAGGFMLNFNLKPGDLGWIKATDRDISLYMQSFKSSPPNTNRLHSFSDGVFFPNVLNNFTINGEDEENCVLQTVDGSQRVAIWADKIKITSDAEIVLDAPKVTITGQLDSGTNGSAVATFRGNVNVNGDVIGDADGATISLNTHVHNGVQSGGSNTGQPVP